MPAGQPVRAFCNFHAPSENATKRRIKNQPLPRLGHLQHLAQRVEKVTIRNPALKPVGGPPLDDLPGLAYAPAAGVRNIEVAALQPLGDGLPAQAGEPEGPAVEHGYIDRAALHATDVCWRSSGQQHDRAKPAAGHLDGDHAWQ